MEILTVVIMAGCGFVLMTVVQMEGWGLWQLCLLKGRDSDSCAHGRVGIVTVMIMAGWRF